VGFLKSEFHLARDQIEQEYIASIVHTYDVEEFVIEYNFGDREVVVVCGPLLHS